MSESVNCESSLSILDCIVQVCFDRYYRMHCQLSALAAFPLPSYLFLRGYRQCCLWNLMPLAFESPLNFVPLIVSGAKPCSTHLTSAIRTFELGSKLVDAVELCPII